jgi:group I intron endonuclease
MVKRCGIYGIYGPGGVYIGQSVDMDSRLQKHRRRLRAGYHTAIKLLKAWQLYGENMFQFRILEECDRSHLVQREQAYFDHYGDLLYNTQRKSWSIVLGNERGSSSLTKQVVLQDGTVYSSIREFSEALGYPNYTVAARHLQAGKTPDEIVALRKRGVGRYERKIYLHDGQYFPSLSEFAVACGYSTIYISDKLRFGKDLNEIAADAGITELPGYTPYHNAKRYRK